MLSRQTLIIIAACAGTAGVLIGALAVVQIWRCCSRKSQPLPPPQLLRRDRERQLAASRPGTMYSQHSLAAPALPFARSSQTSLASARRSSYVNSAEGTAESGSDMTLPSPMELPRHNPTFHVHSPSYSSSPSSPELDAMSPSTPSSNSHASNVRRSSYSVPSRPVSLASATSRNTLRGVPHGPYSNVQIILPAPLALEPGPAGSRPTSFYANANNSGSGSRLSMVDGWASLPVQSERPSRDRRRSLSNNGEPRRSTSSISSQTSQQSRNPRRVSSTPSNMSASASQASHSSSAPPVPRIPSKYSNHSNSSNSRTENSSYFEPQQQGGYVKAADSSSRSSSRGRLSKAGR